MNDLLSGAEPTEYDASSIEVLEGLEPVMTNVPGPVVLLANANFDSQFIRLFLYGSVSSLVFWDPSLHAMVNCLTPEPDPL